MLGRTGLNVENILITLFADIDISHIQVDHEVIFVMVAEKLVFCLHFHPLEGLNRRVVETRRPDIRVAAVPRPQVLFQQEVVGSGNMVVLVGLDASGAVLQVEVELGQLRQNVLVDGHPVVAHHDAAVQWDVLHLLRPRMRVDLL